MYDGTPGYYPTYAYPQTDANGNQWNPNQGYQYPANHQYGSYPVANQNQCDYNAQNATSYSAPPFRRRNGPPEKISVSPPELRLVVLNSGILKPATVFVVPSTSLTDPVSNKYTVRKLEKMIQFPSPDSTTVIGRDSGPEWELRLRIKELAVSKYHATIYRMLKKTEPVTVEETKQDTMYNKNSYHKYRSSQVEVDPRDTFTFDYFIMDNGSTHGTHVNSVRLSEPKKNSMPKQLNHQDKITIGTTIFEAHIHPTEAPLNCPCQAATNSSTGVEKTEPNQKPQETSYIVKEAGPVITRSAKPVMSGDAVSLADAARLTKGIDPNGTVEEIFQALLEKDRRSDVETKRKNELKRLKQEWEIQDKNKRYKPYTDSKYKDRAALRRSTTTETVTPAVVEEVTSKRFQHPIRRTLYGNSDFTEGQTRNIFAPPEIQEDNPGYALLKKMGWSKDKGLGKTGSGMKDPIPLNQWQGTKGLGS